MSLVSKKTNLKSLKFGSPPASDRPGGGNSGQPYITDPISSDIIPQNEDFLLRGGLNAPLDAANDVIRLTKFFGDLKSPRGILFTSKQNILSRIGVATQANGKNWEKSPLNEGSYTPLSTIAQAGVGFTGAHLNKQGANPFKGVNTYIDSKTLVIGENDVNENRLVDFYNKNILQSNESSTLYSYSGGPGSKLGIGKTNIEFATDNKGAPLKTGIKSTTYPTNNVKQDLPFYNPIVNFPSTKITGVSTKYYDEVPLPIVKIGEQLPIFGEVGNSFILNANSLGRDFSISVYEGGSLLSNTPRINDNGTSTWDQFRIAKQVSPNNSKNVADPTLQDFRAPLLEGKKSSTIMGIAPNYSNPQKTIDGVNGSRINYTSPGQKGNIINYSKGKIIDGTRVSIVDRINFLPIYKSSKSKSYTEDGVNDLIAFRIGAVLRGGKKVFMHFRAFIDQFSDSYNAKWNGIQYMGRGEELYKYGGFGRKISLSYTVAAQSKPELMAQYKKLNFLASTLAPDYGGEGGSGYMGGVLTTLTVGGWCDELPGMINSLTLDIPQESPWEITIGSDVEKGKGDPTVKEMPHICKVTMDFTPIHKFRPELQKNDYDGEGEVSKYGNQHYIGLSDKGANNYKPISLADAEKPK